MGLFGGEKRKENTKRFYNNWIGVCSEKVIGFPLYVTHSVSGSLPTCSVVALPVLVTALGKVTGIGTAQEEVPAETVTDTICVSPES
jgi:hypothetical protein